MTFFCVEGENEKNLLKALSVYGRTEIWNLTTRPVSKILRKIKSSIKNVYIVFDVDVIKNENRLNILIKNIDELIKDKRTVFLLQQYKNLEDELCKAGYNNKKNLFKAYKVKKRSDFKEAFNKVSDLQSKLKNDNFKPENLWSVELIPDLQKYNQATYKNLRLK